jgi:hypothetical protein
MSKLFSYEGHWFENDTDASFSFVEVWGSPLPKNDRISDDILTWSKNA